MKAGISQLVIGFIGFIGLIVATVIAVPGWAGFGTCQTYLFSSPTDCWCKYDSTYDYWYFCEEHQFHKQYCEGDMGSCTIDPDTKCFDDEHTNRVKCTDAYACGIECEQVILPCQLTTDRCIVTDP